MYFRVKYDLLKHKKYKVINSLKLLSYSRIFYISDGSDPKLKYYELKKYPECQKKGLRIWLYAAT